MIDMRRCGWVVVLDGTPLSFLMRGTKTEAIKAYGEVFTTEHDFWEYQKLRRKGRAYIIPVYYNPEDVK